MKKDVMFWLWIVTLVYLIAWTTVGYSALPEQVASHFAMNGTPNGWMSRQLCYGIFIGIALLVNIWPPIGRWMVQAAPGLINMPHKEYWLQTPERKTRFAELVERFLTGTMTMTNLILLLAYQVIYQYNTAGQMPSLWPIWILVLTMTAHGLWYLLVALKPPKA